MTAAVRVFGHSGMVATPVASYSSQKSENAIWLLRQPYVANETLSCDTGAADATTAATFADTNIKIVKVEVQSGKTVHSEVTPANQDLRTATTDSPTIYGSEILQFGPSWRLSVLEAT